MIVRARLDLSWSDFGFAVLASFPPGRRRQLTRRIESRCSPSEDVLVCLSVRSGFDLLLEALELPEGSEVLMSAITVPDMARIVRAHGLVPVPVDIDTDTLEPDAESLQRAVSPRSKVLLVAHLLGAVVPLGESRRFARDHGLIFIEDCAQAYAPGEYMGDPESEVRMFSFGPIKTDTALGGAVLHVRDEALLDRMRALHERRPLQTRGSYAKRIFKYALLQLLGSTLLFRVFLIACRFLGMSHDEVIGQAARGFAGGDLLARIRQRPSHPLLALLERRLAHPNTRRIAARTATGRRMTEALERAVRRPAGGAHLHTYWLYPVLTEDPNHLMRFLWGGGFDATRGTSSLAVVDAPPNRPETRARNAESLLEEILFVPVYPEVPQGERDRLAADLVRYHRDRPAPGESASHGTTASVAPPGPGEQPS